MGNVRMGWAHLAAVAGLLGMSTAISPGTVMAADTPPVGLHADLDGAPLDLAKVGLHYCHDFEYPAIHCFSSALGLEAALANDHDAVTDSSTAVNYVIVYEFTSYQGAYMYMSEDYGILGLIGWNDRISSLKGLNSQSGVFWTDWLYSGTRWAFCCSTWYGSLGSYDNTFSSVYRT
jgi:hypothetical protein